MIKSRRIRGAWHAARMEEIRNAYRKFVGKPEGKRPVGRTRCRWVDNIKLDTMSGMDWMDLAKVREEWGALVNTVMNLRVP
jgi:hypothetical protein